MAENASNLERKPDESHRGALCERRPQSALALAECISDPVLRQQRIENLARRWSVADPNAARTALARTPPPWRSATVP